LTTFHTFDLRILGTLHQSNGEYFWPIGGLARHTSEDKQAQNIRTGHEFSEIDGITVLATFQTFALRMLRTLHSRFKLFKSVSYVCIFCSYFLLPFPTLFYQFHTFSYLCTCSSPFIIGLESRVTVKGPLGEKRDAIRHAFKV